MMNVDYQLIGKRIKEERKKKSMTQETLAEHLGVTVGYISQLERGITKISLDTLAAISSLLDCDIGTLVTGSSFGQSQYLDDELARQINELNTREKRLLSGFIDLLQKNRI